MKEFQTVTSAIIRVSRKSLRGFSRHSVQPLDVVLSTAIARACQAVPMVKLEHLREEILHRIINGKLITPEEVEQAETMINELKAEIL